MEQDMKYYEERLECTKRLYKEAQEKDKSVFNEHAHIIKNLIDKYRQFPEHNKLLAVTVERFVLN